MGAIGGMLGLNGGANGTGFSGPAAAPIDKATTVAQANTAYDQTQQGLAQQQQFAQAVAAQNGIGNQTSVFNQLQGVANGTGPNPAQAQLAQATGANTANQAALMAGQRGSNANAGLIARQAAMQGAQNQQQSAGQAASLQAQQSLNALSGLGNLATQQVGQQANATNAYSQAAQGQQQNILNGIAGQNNAAVSQQSNINNANASMAGITMQGQQNLMGSMMPSAGAAMSMFADGGQVDIPPIQSDSGPNIPKIGNAFDPKSSSGGGGGAGVAALLAPGGKIPRQYYANQGNVTPVSQAGQYAPLDPNAPDVFNPGKTNAGAPVSIQAPAAAVPSAVQAAPQVSSNASSADSSGPKSNVGKHLSSNPLGETSKAPGLTGMSKVGDTLGTLIGSGIKSLFSSSQSSGGAGDASASQAAYGNIGGDTAIGTQAQQEMDRQAASNPSVNLQGPQPQSASPMSLDDQGKSNYQDMPDSNFDPDKRTMAEGGKVPAMVSPGEQYLEPKDVEKVKEGKANPLQIGERIPGKPKYPGNDYRNDVVKKTLKSGGLVIPNEVMQSKHPHWAAMKFVQAHMAQGGKVLPKKPKAKK